MEVFKYEGFSFFGSFSQSGKFLIISKFKLIYFSNYMLNMSTKWLMFAQRKQQLKIFINCLIYIKHICLTINCGKKPQSIISNAFIKFKFATLVFISKITFYFSILVFFMSWMEKLHILGPAPLLSLPHLTWKVF